MSDGNQNSTDADQGSMAEIERLLTERIEQLRRDGAE
jgi:hypothetical protein